jgi:hypothetical protein
VPDREVEVDRLFSTNDDELLNMSEYKNLYFPGLFICLSEMSWERGRTLWLVCSKLGKTTASGAFRLVLIAVCVPFPGLPLA